MYRLVARAWCNAACLGRGQACQPVPQSDHAHVYKSGEEAAKAHASEIRIKPILFLDRELSTTANRLADSGWRWTLVSSLRISGLCRQPSHRLKAPPARSDEETRLLSETSASAHQRKNFG
jgi:hypothetical protein